ncbi:MAG: hypothetical protein WCL30_01890, partial [Pseudomonadota bacterium]
YLADVGVMIKDKKDTAILETVSEGPFLWVNLPVGTYKISASTAKVSKSEKITVKKTGLTTRYFHLDVVENNEQ